MNPSLVMKEVLKLERDIVMHDPNVIGSDFVEAEVWFISSVIF